MTAPRIAVIGCGAIAEAFHIPALVRDNDVRRRLVLVDPNIGRTRSLAATFGVSDVVEDYRQVLDSLDGAVVTVPHRLHFPIAMDCVRAGAHVLVEKPLCATLEDARSLVKAADEVGVSVSVNNMRRLYPSNQLIKTLIDSGEIGTVRGIDAEEGEPFEWPAASGAYFGTAAQGQGVVLDRGAHVLDLVCWWLDGEPTLTQCLDDARGGTEAVAHLEFTHDMVRGRVALSWLTKLRNTLRVTGEKGTLEVGIYDWDRVWLEKSGRRRPLRASTHGLKMEQLPNKIIDSFLLAVGGEAPAVSGSDVLPSLGMIQTYYANRSPITMPWYDTFDRIAHA